MIHRGQRCVNQGPRIFGCAVDLSPSAWIMRSSMKDRPTTRHLCMVAFLVLGAGAGCQSNSPSAPQPIHGQFAPSVKNSKADLSSIGLSLMGQEAIGPVRIGMSSDRVVKALGHPDSKSLSVVSEVDAKPHQRWFYKKQGLVLDMISESAKQKVDTVTVSAPSTLKTKRGVGIGANKDSVLTSYAAEIDPSPADGQTIVAGTVYGGLIFGLEKGRVISLVLGAVAE